MTTATAMQAFGPAGNVIRALTPRFSNVDVPVDLSISTRGNVGPVIAFLGPNVAYYIAALVTHDDERLCIDSEGKNFGVNQCVYVNLADVRQAVEAWRPGFWDACRVQREAGG